LSTVPFSERGGKARGCLDLVSGRYPAFVFGGALGAFLPVFHFHEVTREALEPKLRHLADNGYRSVTSEDILAYVRGGVTLPPRAVGLCFDDAWKSLADVAAPLLTQYGLTAITYAIPARITEHGDDDSPFVTWRELAALHASGVIDVQSHTESHSCVFVSADVEDFVQPGYEATPLLNRPQLAAPPALTFLTPADLGAPLYGIRSRMSDGRRMLVRPDVHANCVNLVAREGGAAFFSRPDWRNRLNAIAASAHDVAAESVADQQRSIEDELARSRSILNDRLKTQSVAHICLPWGVSSAPTEAALKRTGYRSAFANRLRGQHAVHPGDDPFWLKRLPNHYITRLPGRGRQYWFS
jgi:peptidoglycan/xylan/chitin deacetylase (PgdA/CDA1 family)